MNHKISIIIPVYKVENYLDRCIESVVNQSYKNLEIILVDDGSPDNCPKICDDWAKKDKRIVVIHKENGGVSSARNYGLDIATGDYVAFVDSDDFVDFSMYEKLINRANQTNADIVMCGYKEVFESGKQRCYNEINRHKVDCENIKKFLFITEFREKDNEIETEGISCSIWRLLIKHNIMKNCRFENSNIAEDFLFLLNLIYKNPQISVVDEYLYYYVIRSSSVMHLFSFDKINQRYIGYKKIINFLEEKSESKLVKNFKFYTYVSILHELLKNKQFDMLKLYMKDEFFVSLNDKENYKEKMSQKCSFKKKFAYFLLHKKWFKLYLSLIKFA